MWDEIKRCTWREYTAAVVGVGVVWGFCWLVPLLWTALGGRIE